MKKKIDAKLKTALNTLNTVYNISKIIFYLLKKIIDDKLQTVLNTLNTVYDISQIIFCIFKKFEKQKKNENNKKNVYDPNARVCNVKNNCPR